MIICVPVCLSRAMAVIAREWEDVGGKAISCEIGSEERRVDDIIAFPIY